MGRAARRRAARDGEAAPGAAPAGVAPAGEGRAALPDFSRSLPMSLLRAREAVMRHFRASLRRFDLTEQQWRVLRALTTREEHEVTELALATFLLAPSLSRILKDLEQRGLVLRRSIESDHRRALISLAPSGRALIAKVTPDSEAIYAEIIARFGAARLAELQATLADLERAMTGFGPEDRRFRPDEP